MRPTLSIADVGVQFAVNEENVYEGFLYLRVSKIFYVRKPGSRIRRVFDLARKQANAHVLSTSCRITFISSKSANHICHGFYHEQVRQNT
jgi:hypothetical protein